MVNRATRSPVDNFFPENFEGTAVQLLLQSWIRKIRAAVRDRSHKCLSFF
jgi:hypothetical protein